MSTGASKKNITEEVIFNAAQGDQTAFKLLYERYAPGVYTTAKRFLHSTDLAQDIMQEVFSIIWQRREKLTEIRDLEYYLITIARNLAYRELSRMAEESALQQEYGNIREESASAEENNRTYREYEELLLRVVEQLPPQQRKVFELTRFEGLSHDDIAKQLNLSRGTVKNHMVRALTSVKEQISPFLGLFVFFFKN